MMATKVSSHLWRESLQPLTKLTANEKSPVLLMLHFDCDVTKATDTLR